MLCEERLVGNPRDFEAAWKLSRTCYWPGRHVGKEERRDQYEQGIAVARRASLMQSGSPAGHFWTAANMGAIAESFGIRAALRYRSPIRERLEIVLGLDPAFQQGSVDQAFDRWDFKVPGVFGGSEDRAIEHLERSLTYNPDSTATLFFLAETLLEMDRAEEPKARLEHVLAGPPDPEWAPEDREFKVKAQVLFETLQSLRSSRLVDPGPGPWNEPRSSTVLIAFGADELHQIADAGPWVGPQ